MSDTATVPTDEQLKEYAAQLPDLYKDILAAYQYLDPSRDRGEGLYEEQLANFLWNEAARNRLIPNAYVDFHESLNDTTRRMIEMGEQISGTPFRNRVATRMSTHRHRFSQAVNEYSDVEFAAGIDRLIENGFLQPRTADETGRLVPTHLGELLIEIIAGKPVPANKLPELPKPTWQ
jgi:hypothetical protein